MGQSPLYNFTQLGIGVESGLAVQQAPTVWLSATDTDFHGTNSWNMRQSNRGNIGREEALAGTYAGSGAFTIEADPDVVGPLCALAMGGEAVVPNPNNGGNNPLAYDHTYTLLIPRKTFTAQWYRKTDTISALGNKISSMEWIFQTNQFVQVRFASSYITDQDTAVPAVPSYSTLKPYRFIDPLNSISIGGTPPTSGMISANVTLNTGLQAPEITLGSGRVAAALPEGQSTVTASIIMQFVDKAQSQRFYGQLGATGPQIDVAGVPIVISAYSRSSINSAVPYRLILTMPNCKITSATVPGRSGGVLQQTLAVEAFESAPQANDDLSLLVTNANAANT